MRWSKYIACDNKFPYKLRHHLIKEILLVSGSAVGKTRSENPDRNAASHDILDSQIMGPTNRKVLMASSSRQYSVLITIRKPTYFTICELHMLPKST